MHFLKALLVLPCLLVTGLLFAQKGTLTGTIKDEISDETIPLASVTWAPGKGVAADIDGKYSVELASGKYQVTFAAVGYEPFVKEVIITSGVVTLDVELSTKEQKAVIVESDFAVGRKVPVAFSNIPLKRVEEELASREVATLANTTPGAYATRVGGGDGDARVTIRGFGGNNVAVMLDGVPVNDMENGTVYWSNWFGLDVVMQTTQIQRGLGASKLVIPAVGGTMNIITRGIEQKKRIQIKQEYIYGGFARTSFGFTSGKLKGNWAFSAAGSFKKGNGWVQGTPTQGFFWYAKVEKVYKKHTFSFYGLGAPQSHGQRSRFDAIALYDKKTAEKLGADTQGIPERGINYNPETGYLTRYKLNGTERTDFSAPEAFSARKNYYHKPQFSLKDLWRINDRLFISTVLYASIGRGGGTRLNNTPDTSKTQFLPNGNYDIQRAYDYNVGALPPTIFGQTNYNYNVNNAIAPGQRYVYDNWVRAAVNNHQWYGLLSTVNFKIDSNFTYSGGLDLRSYRAEHYAIVYDLMGADYLWDRTDPNPNQTSVVRKKNDIIQYNNDALIRWGGMFHQLEFEEGPFSAFLSGSFALTGYKRIDYFLPKVLEGTPGDKYVLDRLGAPSDTLVVNNQGIIPVSYSLNGAQTAMVPDTVTYKGRTYDPTSSDLKYQQTDWHIRQTYTFKAGVNYNINQSMNVFVNGGYLDKAPLFNQVYNNSNQLFAKIYNEKITSVETGFGYKSQMFTSHVNAYWTKWRNRPWSGSALTYPDPTDPQNLLTFNIQGISELHKGIEWDGAFKLNKQFTIEALVSVGDWRFLTKDSVYLFDQSNRPVTINGAPNGKQVVISYDAVGVHVNDAAQSQFGIMLRYEPIEGLYFKTRYTWFDRYYAQANIQTLNGANAGRDSWRIPSYGILEAHAGYGLTRKGVRWDLRASGFNMLNSKVITDAVTNYNQGLYNNKNPLFNASSAGVFFAQGLWFNVSLTATFQ